MSLYGQTVEFWKEVHSATIDRIKEMSDRDIKDYDQATKKNLIASLLDLRKSLKIDDTSTITQLELEMSLKLLTSTYLEKRIRGLNEIKDSIEDLFRYSGQSYLWGKGSQNLLNQALDWVLEQNLLEVLTGEHAHAELLKRSVDLFEMMVKKQRWTVKHLKTLWTSIGGKHESYVRCVFEIVSRMPSCLSAPDLTTLFDAIVESPPDQDEKYLTFLKSFSAAAINSDSRRGSQGDDYGAKILYTLAIEDGNEFAAQCLTDLFAETHSTTKRDVYVEKAMGQFLSGVGVPQAITLALGLLDSMSEQSQAEVIRGINRKQQSGLSVQVAASICKYVETVRKMDITEDVQTTEKCLHSKHLSLRFQLLTLLTRRSQRIDSASLESLWRTMVVAPVLGTDSAGMFGWVSEAVACKALDADKVLGYFGNGEMFVVGNASMESFEAYRGVFLAVNKAAQKLDVRGQVIAKRYAEDLTGFDAALNFAIDASNERVSSAAITLVTECMVLLDYRISATTVWGLFTTGMIRLLQEKNSDRVIRGLKLCHSLLDQKVEVSSYPSSAPRVTFHISTPLKQFPEKVTVPNDAPLGYLRKRVAVLLKCHPSKVVLKGYRTFELSEDEQAVAKVLAHAVYINAEVNTVALTDVKAHELLAGSDSMYDSLFALAAEPATSELAWELLMKLPTSKQLKRQLEQINKPAFEPQQSFHKRLYSLIVIAELCQSASYAERFLSTKEGQSLIKDVFETKVLTLECSGLLIVKFAEVVCQLVTRLVKRRLNVLQTRVVLHQSVNYLYCLSQKTVKGCEAAVGEVRKLLEACFVEADISLYAGCFATHTKLKDVLLQLLVRSESGEIRKSMFDFVLFFSNPPFSLSQIFLQKLLELLLTALKEPTSLHYFSTVSKLVRLSGQSFFDVLNDSRKQLMASLAVHSEKSSQEQDDGLIGGLYLVRSIVKTLKLECRPDELEFVMKDCLLNMSPLCKSQNTRKHALKLLGEMIAHSPNSLPSLLPQLSSLYISPSWRTGRVADWEISSDTGEKSSAGFVGIRNTGCICYMISVLQQLFMVKSFRSQVLGLDVSPHEQVGDNMLYVCQRIFAGLSYSSKQYVGIRRLCEALKDSSAVNVNEQMDVEEFLNAFMDKLEGRLGPNRSIIGDHFGGQIATEIIGKQACTHTSERVEQFLTLPLEVKTKKSLTESLESLVFGETLEGDNAYQCDQCGARVTAQRRQGIRHLPNILLLALRRFDYDFDTMRRVKLNDQYEFPWELDLEPYTIEGLHRRDAAEDGDVPPEHPSDYYQYRLRGIVIHMGSAEGGHYYCFIQDRGTSKWLEFNDTLVREVDQGDIPAEAYGGQEQFNVSSVYGDVTETQEKVSSAYLLLYERLGQYAFRDPAERGIKRTVLAGDVPEADSTKGLVDGVIARNRKFWSRKTAFAHEFVDFVLHLIQSNTQDLHLFQLAASFFLTVVIRSKDRYSMHLFVPELHAALQQSVLAANWLIEMVAVPEVIQEIFLVCPVSYIRRVVIGLVQEAAAVVDDARKNTALENVLALLSKARESQHYTQFFQLVYTLSRKTVIDRHLNLSGRLIDFVLGQNSTPLQPLVCEQADVMLGYGDGFSPSDGHFTAVSASKNPSISYALAVLSECELTEAERDDVLGKDFFQAMLKMVEGKTGAREAGRLYYGLIRDDEAAGRAVLGYLMTSVHEDGKEVKRMSLKILAHVLGREGDALVQERVSMILTELAARMKAGSTTRDRTIVEMLGPFIHKLCLHNETACLWVNENWKSFNWLEDWVRRWTYPTYFGVDSLESSVAKQLRALAGGRVKADTEDWDSDEELELKKDTVVRVYKAITDAYEYVVITEVLGDVARGKVESRDNAIVWVEADSDEARPSKYRSSLAPQYKMRMVMEPMGGEKVSQTREPMENLTLVDSLSPSVASAKSSLSHTYQYFRRAGDNPDGFFRALGIALLEHYCRKTTTVIELENFRKWLRRQTGVTEVKNGCEEEFSEMSRVLSILSEDKRDLPGLTMFQLQNLLAYQEFDRVLVRMFRMMVINALTAHARTLGVTGAALDKYEREWESVAADDTVIRAAAVGFDVYLLVEDCSTAEFRPKHYPAATTTESRPFIQLFRYRRGFLILYKNKLTLIDGFDNGQFNTASATSTEQGYMGECYGQVTG